MGGHPRAERLGLLLRIECGLRGLRAFGFPCRTRLEHRFPFGGDGLADFLQACDLSRQSRFAFAQNRRLLLKLGGVFVSLLLARRGRLTLAKSLGVPLAALPVEFGLQCRKLLRAGIDLLRPFREFIRTATELILERQSCRIGVVERRFPVAHCLAIRFQTRLQFQHLHRTRFQNRRLFGKLRRARIEVDFLLVNPLLGRTQIVFLALNIVERRGQ